MPYMFLYSYKHCHTEDCLFNMQDSQVITKRLIASLDNYSRDVCVCLSFDAVTEIFCVLSTESTVLNNLI